MPVVGGAGGYNTAEVIELAREVEALGADGILSVTPVLQQADTGRPVPTLQSHRIGHQDSRSLFTAWPAAPESTSSRPH